MNSPTASMSSMKRSKHSDSLPAHSWHVPSQADGNSVSAACMPATQKLLLLDEPTAGVDPNARRDFWEELRELAAKGVSVLISTHYMDEAERCHKLAYIAYGNLLA